MNLDGVNKPLHQLSQGDRCGVHPVEGTAFSVDLRNSNNGTISIYRDGIYDPITDAAALAAFFGRELGGAFALDLNTWLVERWNREHAPAT